MIVDVDRYGAFQLDEEFLAPYRQRPVRWGFGALSWITFKRTYSRDGEQWWQTCRRVIEGMVTVQRVHCLQEGLPWDQEEARQVAREAYDRLWGFQWTPRAPSDNNPLVEVCRRAALLRTDHAAAVRVDGRQAQAAGR